MTDIRLEKMVSWVLRTGVMIAAAVVLGGGACYVLGHAEQESGAHKFQGEPAQYRHVGEMAGAALGGDCRAIIQFGLLLLIATPVLRVALSLVGFAAERDRTYVIVTAIVLGILLFSLTGKV
ncbi:MAG TPA: DUF1634 domain-containing protein [Bryobacteraceae bacterium]|nr:DUF1634 domain-containing protein [Bryobacteraceae bacterium]